MKSFRLLAFLCLMAPQVLAAESQKITVFAAASLTDVLPKVASAWSSSSGQEIKFSFDGSSRLAKQINAGAPADLYFSANTVWMDFLAKSGKIVRSSRVDLLKNTLVLAAPKSSGPTDGSVSDVNFKALAKLALAGENVPAGMYAQEALQDLGIWDTVKYKIIRGQNVRTVLGWLSLGEVPAGIVYRTDALNAKNNVSIVSSFPPSTHAPIVYSVAVVERSRMKQAAESFLNFCRTEPAVRIFRSAGFEIRVGG